MIHATLYEHNQERIEKNAIKPNLIRYAETSMKTGLGLQYIYDYRGVPFLQLQVRENSFYFSFFSQKVFTCYSSIFCGGYIYIFIYRWNHLKNNWN